jgi:micrococcal nuclease
MLRNHRRSPYFAHTRVVNAWRPGEHVGRALRIDTALLVNTALRIGGALRVGIPLFMVGTIAAGCVAPTHPGDAHTIPDDTAGAATDTARPVIDVIDGDTIVIDVSGTHETVRLLGIDAPETKHPRRPVECHGPQSYELLRSLLPSGTRVYVRRDIVARDHFGRLLLYVWRLDGTFVNRELVVRGAARPLTTPPNGAHHDDFVGAAFDAHRYRRGWWALCVDGHR